ncbi:uncharacterized protein PgNI_08221 [Pyricularia grisea]|uniref:Uncharacterized protein n=1 Tax=Pyricularia grisea TaxID=148305 RepID=A0A6P8AWF6_PYRGI|nr:uncharacterized protein PgNI_08221 [Pyricularia grisea]TLD06553.1 hypothetical protein PgNI_08221 [Pyricularia grisea]
MQNIQAVCRCAETKHPEESRSAGNCGKEPQKWNEAKEGGTEMGETEKQQTGRGERSAAELKAGSAGLASL